MPSGPTHHHQSILWLGEGGGHQDSSHLCYCHCLKTQIETYSRFSSRFASGSTLGRSEERELAQTSGKCRSFAVYDIQTIQHFVHILYQLCISFIRVRMASIGSTSPSASEGSVLIVPLRGDRPVLGGEEPLRLRLTGSMKKQRAGAINLPPRRQAHSQQDVCHEPPKPVNHIISGARLARSAPVW